MSHPISPSQPLKLPSDVVEGFLSGIYPGAVVDGFFEGAMNVTSVKDVLISGRLFIQMA
jgi:hypothetical protein